MRSRQEIKEAYSILHRMLNTSQKVSRQQDSGAEISTLTDMSVFFVRAEHRSMALSYAPDRDVGNRSSTTSKPRLYMRIQSFLGVKDEESNPSEPYAFPLEMNNNVKEGERDLFCCDEADEVRLMCQINYIQRCQSLAEAISNRGVGHAPLLLFVD